MSAYWRRRLRQQAKRLKLLAKDSSFYAITYWDFHVEFFQNFHRHRIEDFIDYEEFFSDCSWSFIEISREELEGVERPENRICACQLKIMDSTFKFQAWGEHSGEKFETEELPIKKIAQPISCWWFWRLLNSIIYTNLAGIAGIIQWIPFIR